VSTPPPSDLSTAVRAALPPHLQHLVSPLVGYLEAAATLRDLASDPSASIAVAQALTSLRGTEVSLPAGVVAFGDSANLGDVTLRDTAGRDIINLTITLPSATPPAPSHGLDAGQLRLLRMLVERPTSREGINHTVFAERTGMTVEEIADELKLLKQRGLLVLQLTLASTFVTVTPEGRKILRTIDQGAPS